MKIKKSIAALVILFYIALIYFSPPIYVDKPKLFLLRTARLPLNLTNLISRKINYLAHSGAMIQKNRSLRETVDALTMQLSRYRDIEQENERLRKLLGFKKASSFRLTAAGIIAKDSSNFSDTAVINKGLKQGIESDTVVIAEAGLAGRIYEASSSVSRVMLITDPNSSISAIISSTRQIGMVYGTPSNLCKLKYIPLTADITIGDEVLTSGFSDIFPKGILIGKVIKVIREPRGLSLSAVVEPAVDFTRLEEVLCIE